MTAVKGHKTGITLGQGIVRQMSKGTTIFDTKNAQNLTGEEEIALESELMRIFSNSR